MFEVKLTHPHHFDAETGKNPEKISIEFMPLDHMTNDMLQQLWEARVTLTTVAGQPCIAKLEIDFIARVQEEPTIEDVSLSEWLREALVKDGYTTIADKKKRDAFGVPYNEE